MTLFLTFSNLLIVWEEVLKRLKSKQDKIEDGDTLVTINGKDIPYKGKISLEGLDNNLSKLLIGKVLASKSNLATAAVSLSKNILDFSFEFPQGGDGVKGLSAYELAVLEGYQGDLDEWLESLKGKPGSNGISWRISEDGQYWENSSDGGTTWLNTGISINVAAADPNWDKAPRASHNNFGVVQIGNGLEVNNGVISVATSSNPGESGQETPVVGIRYIWLFCITDGKRPTLPNPAYAYLDLEDPNSFIYDTSETYEWHRSVDESALNQNEILWMSQGSFKANNECEGWSPAINLSGGEGGPGSDKPETEFLYHRTSSTLVPETPEFNPNELDDFHDHEGEYEEGRIIIDKNGKQWYDNNISVSENERFVYISFAYKINGSWTTFSPPTVIAEYGKLAIDGDGILYIFSYNNILELTSRYPSKQDTTERDLDRLSNPSDLYIPDGWADDYLEISAEHPEVYASTRRFHKLKDGKKYWDDFSAPKLWNRFAKDGQSQPGIKEVAVYLSFYDGSTPSAPSGIEVPPSGWSLAPSDVSNLTIYVSYAWVTAQNKLATKQDGAPREGWSKPVVYRYKIASNYLVNYVYKTSEKLLSSAFALNGSTKFYEIFRKNIGKSIKTLDESLESGWAKDNGSVTLKANEYLWQTTVLVNGVTDLVISVALPQLITPYTTIVDLGGSSSVATTVLRFAITTTGAAPTVNRSLENPGEVWKESFDSASLKNTETVWMISALKNTASEKYVNVGSTVPIYWSSPVYYMGKTTGDTTGNTGPLGKDGIAGTPASSLLSIFTYVVGMDVAPTIKDDTLLTKVYQSTTLDSANKLYFLYSDALEAATKAIENPKLGENVFIYVYYGQLTWSLVSNTDTSSTAPSKIWQATYNWSTTASRVTGTVGLLGKPGSTKILESKGVYNPTAIYFTTDTTAPYVYYDGNMYILNTATGIKVSEKSNGSSILPTSLSNKEHWVEMQFYEALMSKYLIAGAGMIGKWVFLDNWMYSADGKDLELENKVNSALTKYIEAEASKNKAYTEWKSQELNESLALLNGLDYNQKLVEDAKQAYDNAVKNVENAINELQLAQDLFDKSTYIDFNPTAPDGSSSNAPKSVFPTTGWVPNFAINSQTGEAYFHHNNTLITFTEGTLLFANSYNGSKVIFGFYTEGDKDLLSPTGLAVLWFLKKDGTGINIGPDGIKEIGGGLDNIDGKTELLLADRSLTLIKQLDLITFINNVFTLENGRLLVRADWETSWNNLTKININTPIYKYTPAKNSVTKQYVEQGATTLLTSTYFSTLPKYTDVLKYPVLTNTTDNSKLTDSEYCIVQSEVFKTFINSATSDPAAYDKVADNKLFRVFDSNGQSNITISSPIYISKYNLENYFREYGAATVSSRNTRGTLLNTPNLWSYLAYSLPSYLEISTNQYDDGIFSNFAMLDSGLKFEVYNISKDLNVRKLTLAIGSI